MYNIRLLFKDHITPDVESEIINIINTNAQLYFGIAQKALISFQEYTELKIEKEKLLYTDKNISNTIVNKNIDLNWLFVENSSEAACIIDNYSSSYFGIFKRSTDEVELYSEKFTIFEHYMHNNEEYRMLAVSFSEEKNMNNFIAEIDNFSDFIDLIIQD